MKVLIGIFLSLVFTVNLFGMRLVFKLKQSVPNNEVTSLATIDTSKYGQIRITIKSKNTFEFSRLTPEEKKKNLKYNNFWVYQIEEADEFILYGQSTQEAISQSFIIDGPPSQIVVKVRGAGDYSLFVYGQ